MATGMNIADTVIDYVIAVVIVGAVIGALGTLLLSSLTGIAGNMSAFGLGGLFSVTLLGILFSVFLFRKIKGLVEGKTGKY